MIPDQLTETHCSFVNTWECDENAHLNVQFYLKRFDEAARFFNLLHGSGTHDGPLPSARHVRYHAELPSGRTTRILSGQIADGAFGGWVVHVMEDTVTARISATAIDGPSGVKFKNQVPESAVTTALPRSVETPRPPRTGSEVLGVGGVVSHQCIAQPGECDVQGRLLQQFYVAHMSNAAARVWDHAGIDIKWLEENNFGRVAVEMKLVHHEAARAGDAVMLYSVPEAMGRKTLRLHHELVRASDGAALMTSEVVALIMDLGTRKVVQIPDSIAERLNSLAIAGD